MSKRMRQAAIVGTTAIAWLIGAASLAGAATGQVGPHDNPEVSCNTTLEPALQVHTPAIQASTVPEQPDVFRVGPNHVQWVGFRSWLLRWNGSAWAYTDQNRDGRFDYGPLYQAQVASAGNSWMPPSQWWNADQGRWEAGTSFFPIRFRGSYRVRMEFFWYADQYAGSGYDVLDSINHYVSIGMMTQSYAWCQY